MIGKLLEVIDAVDPRVRRLEKRVAKLEGLIRAAIDALASVVMSRGTSRDSVVKVIVQLERSLWEDE